MNSGGYVSPFSIKGGELWMVMYVWNKNNRNDAQNSGEYQKLWKIMSGVCLSVCISYPPLQYLPGYTWNRGWQNTMAVGSWRLFTGIVAIQTEVVNIHLLALLMVTENPPWKAHFALIFFWRALAINFFPLHHVHHRTLSTRLIAYGKLYKRYPTNLPVPQNSTPDFSILQHKQKQNHYYENQEFARCRKFLPQGITPMNSRGAWLG